METNSDAEDGGGTRAAEQTPSLHTYLANITKEIGELKKDMKHDLVDFNSTLTSDRNLQISRIMLIGNYKQSVTNYKNIRKTLTMLRHVLKILRCLIWKVRKPC